MGTRPNIGAASERVQRTCALSDSVERVRFVKGARAEALARMGIRRVRDLLLHVPRRYDDFSHPTTVAMADVGSEATLKVTVDKVLLKRPRPRMQVVEVYAFDETGVIEASFFRQPWLADKVHPGDVVALSGKVTFAYGFKQMRGPYLEVLDAKAAREGRYARVLPHYPLTEGVSDGMMRRYVSTALGDLGDVADWVPAPLVARRRLMGEGRALREVHFPPTPAAAEDARRRLAYDELLALQLALLSRRTIELADVVPTAHVTDGPHVEALRAALPFSLTDEQEAACREILADMASPHVMNRLLLGDVGTGKTAVAAVALAAVADTGTQAAVMAPTSVLARQYAEKVGPLLTRAYVRWALVTGATPSDERALTSSALARGELTVVFGTTAVLGDDMDFSALSLVVIDEQHRFGVDQRAALRRKGAGADLLAMTATPIPRTLALSLYGDVEVSRIRHRPRAGAGVETHVLAPENLDLAWGGIREALDAGYQAYVVCPLVDDADDGADLDDVPDSVKSGAAKPHSATRTLEEVGRLLPDVRCALLTGRMGAADKDSVMDDFRAGRVRVLVCTTVIEVGVDVPNATAMLVRDADRFGLATLHQLRGRVGRGDAAGTVWLECAARKDSPARQRLAALERTTDGFELAELDLKLRREGEVLGYRQSGSVPLVVADLDADKDLVQWAHDDARAITAGDPGLARPEHITCALEVRDRFGAYFDELERA